MDAAADALDVFGEGGFAIHSDAPVTPMAPLFTAWVAVNRLTQSGVTLGEAQKIGVASALRAITLGAAHVLKLDHEVGSLAAGRRADFCVLEDDPMAVDPSALKDIPIRATVLGGAVTEA
jgi:predicted amidohydrolase YtcJ